MSGIVDFQRRMLNDEATRKAFAADPAKTLAGLGVTLPEGLKLPPTIDINVIDARLNEAKKAAAEEKISLPDVNKNDSAEALRVIEDTLPVRTRDLVDAKAVHQTLTHGGEAATAAVVAVLVVAAVVAVPVATVGRTAEGMERLNPALGIEKVSRGALGLTVQGPGGLRVEGLNVGQVADLIKAVR